MSTQNEGVLMIQEMTGLDAVSCESLLAAANGDVETALAIFFERQDSSTEQTSTTNTNSDASANVSASSTSHSILFESKQVPLAWAEQGFVSIKGTMNVLQARNGPCGVLACLLAQIAVMRLENNDVMDTEVKPDEIKEAIFRVLSRCLTKKGSKVLTYNGRPIQSFKDLNEQEITQPGCLVTLVQSIVDTKGEDEIRKEVASSNGELPLIVGPHSLCGSELISLLIRGTANGNFSAVNPQTGKIVEEREWIVPNRQFQAGFGLLSRPTDQVPVANSLRFPKFPVWILHGGDHFTLLICTNVANKTFLHLNGLPPAGPTSAVLTISYVEEAEPITEKSASQFAYVKPIPGEIEDIVQANGEDKNKFKDDWRKWRLECILAVDDPTVQSSRAAPPPNKQKANAKIYDLGEEPKVGEKFRCAACYRDRYRTMVFGEQVRQANQSNCSFCGKPLKEAGWTLWMPYGDLPPAIQRMADRMFAPKILNVIRTRWPDANVKLGAGDAAVDGPLPST